MMSRQLQVLMVLTVGLLQSAPASAQLGAAEALEQNLRMLEESLKVGWERMTGQGIQQWASVDVTRNLFKDMFPSTINRILGYSAGGMTDEQLIAALSRNTEYMGLVQRKVQGMKFGELESAAKEAYDLYGERQLDALQQAHWAQSSRAELEAHFASLSPAELWRQAYRLILNQFENLTGDRLETWARREVTMHLWQDMFPSTVNRILGYDASGMNDRQKIAALSRNPEYTGLVQRKVDTMFAGRLRVSALLAWLEQAPVNAGTITPAQAAALLKP